MMLARRVYGLRTSWRRPAAVARAACEAPAPLAFDREALRRHFAARRWACVEAFELRELREELVKELKGLQVMETQHVRALVATDMSCCAGLQRLFEGMAALQSLAAQLALGAQRPRCALVAVPPGGFVLPQRLCGSAEGLSFCLFLTGDWWAAGDGGALELYGKGTATRIVPRVGRLVLYEMEATGIGKVLTEEGPQLALHGIFPTGESLEMPSTLLSSRPFLSVTEDHEVELRDLSGIVSQRYLEELHGLRARFEDESKPLFRSDSLCSNHMRVRKAALRLSLPGFLRPELASRLLRALQRARRRGGWKLQGPPLLRRCQSFRKGCCPGGRALAALATTLARSFPGYLRQLTGLRLGRLSLVLRRFRPADYERPGRSGAQLDAVLVLAWGRGGGDVYAGAEAPERAAELSGLLAGPEAVPLPAEALLRLRPRYNVLHLVLRDARTCRLVEPVVRGSRYELRFSAAVPKRKRERSRGKALGERWGEALGLQHGAPLDWKSTQKQSQQQCQPTCQALTVPVIRDMGSQWR